MKRTFETLIACAVVGGALTFLAGCQGENTRDLGGVHYRAPDKIEGFLNVDGQPNVTRMCIDGVAFLTSSRDYNSVMRIPEWDSWCKG